MSEEQLKRKYDRLVDKVRQMRGVQKDYFKYRLKQDQERSKRLEREVDQIIADEVKVMNSKQENLF